MLGSTEGKLVGVRLTRDAAPAMHLRADAFRELADRHLDEAYRLAAVILNDRVEAEDAVHDAAVAAWRGFASLRDPDHFKPWFRRIVINQCRDRLRHRARHQVSDVTRELREAEHPRVDDDSDALALRDIVGRATGTLTPDEQVVVAMRFYLDMTIPAIADALAIPEGTVKSRLHHAMRRLQRAIEAADR
jgi:RNA polymerase sigma-70 factor (ECF subfamily)